MLFVLSGEIRTYLLSEEGREVTLFRLYPGELCVLSASCVISQITFDTQMTAGMDTEVLIIPANVIAALKEQNLHVRCFLYELATKRFSDVMWAMQQIMFKGLDRRLAEFLLAEAERTGSDTIRMTHEQIAQHISSAREAVARMLKSFSEDGLVELKTRCDHAAQCRWTPSSEIKNVTIQKIRCSKSTGFFYQCDLVT